MQRVARQQGTEEHPGEEHPGEGHSGEGHPTDPPPSGKGRNGRQAKTEANRTKLLSLKNLYSTLHRTSEVMLKGGEKQCEKGEYMTGADHQEDSHREDIHREDFHMEEASLPNEKVDVPSSSRGAQQKRRIRKVDDRKATRENANDIRRYFTQEKRRSRSVREGSNGTSVQASSESDVEARRKTRSGEKIGRNGPTRGRSEKRRAEQCAVRCDVQSDALSDRPVRPPRSSHSDQSINRVLKGHSRQGIRRKGSDEQEPSGSNPRSGLWRGARKRESNKEKTKQTLDERNEEKTKQPLHQRNKEKAKQPFKGRNRKEEDESMYSLSPRLRRRRNGGTTNMEEEAPKSEETIQSGDTSPVRERKGTKYNNIKEEEESGKFRNMTLEDIKNRLRKNEPDTLKILLCTDNHLGYKENNAVQRKDTFNSFEEILFLAKHLNVDMIINSGDLFHKNKVSEYTLFKSMEIIRRYCHVRGYEDSEAGAESVEASPARGTHPRRALLKEVHCSDYKWYGGDDNLDLGEESSHSGGSTRSDKHGHSDNRSRSEGSSHSDNRSRSEGSSHSDNRSRSGESTPCEELPPRDTFHMCPVKGKVETAIPLFTMHGNHDYPYSCDYISPLDILHVGNLIKYIGKSSLNRIVVKPVLLNKEDTKVAIYAIGWIKDERLHRAFEKKQVKFLLPNDHACRINILVLHQNRYMRCAHGNDLRNFIKESFIPNFVDLVIWGHEHFSKPYLEESSLQSFFSLQLGSSVRTSLCTNEYGDKYIGLLEIRKERFRFLKIQLESVRPFELKEIRLANYHLNFNDESVLKQFLHEQVSTILDTFQLSLREQVKRYYLFRRAFLAEVGRGRIGKGKGGKGRSDKGRSDKGRSDKGRSDKGRNDKGISGKAISDKRLSDNRTDNTGIADEEDPRSQLSEDQCATRGHPALPSEVFTERELLDEYFDSLISDQDVTHFLSNLQNEEFYSTTFIHVAFSTPSDTFDLLRIKKGVYDKPLIKLKVEYEDINIINTQLFGSTFVSRVGNPSEFLTFYRKKGKTSGSTKDGQGTNCTGHTLGRVNTMGMQPTNMDQKDILMMENINEYNKVFDILFNYCQLREGLSILNEKTIMETILNFMSNSNSSFNSESTGTSDYCNIISMVDHWARSKVNLLEGSLRDVPVESLTEEYLAEVVKNSAGE
ncbi:double-strand break repair protein MRE11 [Plasmodium inui San Antonio 1]|uniref:Double-strand break repair protein MRE11 n=1 Tax=Plasmodium inui San Antonio 1 TaxID=1237626 RepID=W6ZZN3_9APIC|nr:double-strand break repair protein MRE11 [Plasmodium inui San Antonio 1]EUD64750.1 double-strand break repair protein MRE11 [Plasmodium inui San Antonio 1]